jgi:hypothetical protein
MKRITGVVTMLLVLSVALPAVALETGHATENKVVGGYLSLGIGMAAGDGIEGLDPLIARNDRTAKFVSGGLAYFDYYFTAMIGIEGGLGFQTKGLRYRLDNDWVRRFRVLYMEFPISFKLDFRHFQFTVGFALSVALAGLTSTDDNGDAVLERWNNNEWDIFHRVNFGPRLTFSYAIPVGPVFIVPGISWMIHFINDLNNDEINNPNEEFRSRFMNLMFNAGVEWGF